MVVPPNEPDATSDLGPSETGGTRKLRLDEMAAQREHAALPPAPVLTLKPVPVDAAPVGAGRRGAMKRLAEVEALARTNLRAAEEARRVLEAERALLEEQADARTRAERTAAQLRRELDRLRETEEQRAAQARFAAAAQARSELESEMDRVHDEHARVVDELDRMRGTLFDHDSLLDEYSQRLHEEQEAQARARAEQVRAEEAKRTAERNLEIALETARRRAEDDHGRLVKLEEQLRDAVVERDRVADELRVITEGGGELVRLRAEATATHEDMTRLLSDLDVQSARADKAERELAIAIEARDAAERSESDAIEARDLAGIDLETTRRELAERNEALDAERTAAQSKIADLNAQLATTTRTAENATMRAADLEARLDTATEARDTAEARVRDLTEQLERAEAAVEELRKHSSTIGDELATTHATLELTNIEHDETRRQLERARRDLERAARAAGAPRADSPSGVAPEVAEVEPVPLAAVESPAGASELDEALGTGGSFGEAAAGDDEAETAAEIEAKIRAKVRGKGRRSPSPVTTFRTVDTGLTPTRPGGPEVEREAAMIRHLAPVDPEPRAADADEVGDGEGAEAQEPQPAKPVPAWRRTAMAELTALAADDDFTPNRRR